MIKPEVLDALVAAGATAEMIAAAVKADQARLDVPLNEWRAMRAAVIARDGAVCAYCSAPNSFQCDHVVPRARGGKSEMSNLAASCKSCNSSKRDKLLHEWVRQ